MLEIVDTRFIATHESVHHNDETRIQLGRVEITYSDGLMETFNNVDRSKYLRWERSGWSDDDMPPQIELRPELDEDSVEVEDESDYEIREDDYLGQVTGFPTPGHDVETETQRHNTIEKDEDEE